MKERMDLSLFEYFYQSVHNNNHHHQFLRNTETYNYQKHSSLKK